MNNRAELWESYRPKLAEARTRDRVEQSQLFLPITARVGRFNIAPMTVQRLLVLESLESPFLGGQSMPTRRDVLVFLYVVSPGFKLSRWRMRYWFVRHVFILWPWYTMQIAELMQEASKLMGTDKNEPKSGDEGSAWAAMIIDGFASQYGWSLNQIMDLPMATAVLLGKAMGARLSMDSKGGAKASVSRHADKVRGDYLEEVKAIDKREREMNG